MTALKNKRINFFIPKNLSIYLYVMSNQLYKGALSNLILKLLSENSKMYGYEITKKIKEQTNNELQLTEESHYTTLHKLESENVLDVEYEQVNGRTRKYYKLTESGKIIADNKLKLFVDNLAFFKIPKIS
jgi:DNA-binding PadR family transcriptional regulator